jgi:hypothetical protein
MCVICVFCFIVAPLPPGKNPFADKINNNNNNLFQLQHKKLEQTLILSMKRKKKEKLLEGFFMCLYVVLSLSL